MKRSELVENICKKGSFLCVGLDRDIKKIPEHLLNEEYPLFAFNKAIIDATAPYTVAYKPNLAFYESLNHNSFTCSIKEFTKVNPVNNSFIAKIKRKIKKILKI